MVLILTQLHSFYSESFEPSETEFLWLTTEVMLTTSKCDALDRVSKIMHIIHSAHSRDLTMIIHNLKI